MSETKVTDPNESVSKNLKEFIDRNCYETGIFPTIRLANCYVKCFEGLCVDEANKEIITKVSDYNLGTWWLETPLRNISVDIHCFSRFNYCVVPQFVGRHIISRTNARIKDYGQKTKAVGMKIPTCREKTNMGLVGAKTPLKMEI